MANMTDICLGLRGHLTTLTELPAARAWTNKEYTPIDGVPYIEEDFVPGFNALRGLVKGGTLEQTGLYVIRWYGIANAGLGEQSAGVDALLRLFKPGTTITLDTGDTVRVRADIAPNSSAVTQDGAARAVVTVTVPWRCYSPNA